MDPENNAQGGFPRAGKIIMNELGQALTNSSVPLASRIDKAMKRFAVLQEEQKNVIDELGRLREEVGAERHTWDARAKTIDHALEELIRAAGKATGYQR